MPQFSETEIREKMGKVAHWYHQMELAPGVVTPGSNLSALYLEELDIPGDCKGMRVLDLGTRDGFFAFEFEKRGAEVVAVDYLPADQTGFACASEVLGSKIEYRQDNIYNITPEGYGTFDIVLFLGLIYRLRDPMDALDRVRELCRNEMYLETQLLDNAVLMPGGGDLCSLLR